MASIPGDVDLAILVVPAKYVANAARDCGENGVRGLVCITAGFAEVGDEGVERQRELMEICETYGMRLIGPNCMGILNTADEFKMNASFANSKLKPGEAAFMSQSGALGAVILNDAEVLGLGMSMFASLGNRPDVSPSDLLEYWEADPATKQVLMYLEAFGRTRALHVDRAPRVAHQTDPRREVRPERARRSRCDLPHRLARGFRSGRGLAARAMRRVCAWTR